MRPLLLNYSTGTLLADSEGGLTSRLSGNHGVFSFLHLPFSVVPSSDLVTRHNSSVWILLAQLNKLPIHPLLWKPEPSTMISFFEVAVLLLCVAVSGLHVLQPPVLDHCLLEISPGNPGVSAAAGAATLLALPIAYFAGIILVYLQIAPATPPALVPPVALMRLLLAMACALLLLLATTPLLLPWLFSM